ncbi:MAG: DUF2142 domain-containing protein [Oscillospiraceae bacterium]|nr:DUF2142 domain-containing protein [Oscillospiraceae bacterium]
MKLFDSDLYDGGLKKDGVFFFLFCCITLLFTLDFSTVSIPFLIVYAILSVCSFIWCANTYKLQMNVEKLVVPLFFAVGIFYSFGLPISNELETSFSVSLSDGQFFSRLLYLPFYHLFKSFAPHSFATYLARLFSVIICSLILGFSVQTIPYGETIISMVALLPSSINQMVKGTAISTSLFLSILFISLVIRVAYTKSFYVMTTRYRFALLFACSILVLSDLACLAFWALLFMIPERCHGDKKNRLRFVAVLTIVLVAVLIYRFYTTGNYSTSVFSKKTVFVQQVLQTPFRFILTLFRTFFVEGGNYLLNVFSLENSPLNTPWPLILSLAVVFVYTVYFDAGLSPKRYYVIRCTLIACLLFIAVIGTKGYLFSTSNSSGLMNSLKGTEFLPVFVPLIFFIKRLFKHPAAPQKNLSFAVLISVLVDLASGLYYFK